jgi:hypothetical protein
MSPIVVGKLCEKMKVIAFFRKCKVFNMSLRYLKRHHSILPYLRITKQVSLWNLELSPKMTTYET